MKVFVSSLEELKAFANDLSHLAQKGDVLLLKGPLGSGKTEFARAFIRSLCGEKEEVPSPTFTLLQVYDSKKGPLSHFDLYRLELPEDVWELGLEEALSEGITLIEWPERLPPLTLASSLTLTFNILSPTLREVDVFPQGSWTERFKEDG